MKKLQVTIELIEEMLGTANSDPKIHEEFIASKAPDAASREEEVEALGVEAVVEKARRFSRRKTANRSSTRIKSAGSSKRPPDSCSVARVKNSPSTQIKSRLTRKSSTVVSLSNRGKS